MQLEKYKESSYSYSETASKLVSQFALAGIAVIWIFKSDKPNEPLIPVKLLDPLICFVATLLFALLQNFIASILWGLFYMYHEAKNNGNSNVEKKAPYILPFVTWSLYILKVCALSLGFIYIGIFLFDKVKHPKKATEEMSIPKSPTKKVNSSNGYKTNSSI